MLSKVTIFLFIQVEHSYEASIYGLPKEEHTIAVVLEGKSIYLFLVEVFLWIRQFFFPSTLLEVKATIWYQIVFSN